MLIKCAFLTAKATFKQLSICGIWSGLFTATLGLSLISTQAFAQNDIPIGVSAAESGASAPAYKDMIAGAKLHFDTVNQAGGINGRKIRLIERPDGSDPKKSGENAKLLIEEDKVIALFLVRGTSNAEAMIKISDPAGVPFIAPSSGAMVLHQPMMRTVFNVRSTYQGELIKIIDDMAARKVKRIALIHVSDSFGKDGLIGANIGFKKHSITPVSVVTYDRADPKLDDPIKALVASKPDVVIGVGAVKAMAETVKKLRQAGSQAMFITLSNNSSSTFVSELGEFGRGVIVSQVYQNPESMATPLGIEMKRLIGNKPLEPTFTMAQGFCSAKALTEGLKRAGKIVTRESLIKAMESFRDVDICGDKITFGPNDRTGSTFVELSIINRKGKFTQ